jgi:hypothetical protein
MSDALERLKEGIHAGAVDAALCARVEGEFSELRRKADAMEELLIVIVRTGWPWDDDGIPNAIHGACRDGFTTAMLEARDLLGLQRLSTINRTEPRT